MARGLRRSLDGAQGVVHFFAEAGGQSGGNTPVFRLELPDVLREVGVVEDFHCSAARNSSSVNLAVRPDATSSIRRTPAATASFSAAGQTTLSTNRRANSIRSSAGKAKTVSATPRMGGTGHWLVPSGHWPDGTEGSLPLPLAIECFRPRSLPSGGSPLGTGESPVLPRISSQRKRVTPAVTVHTCCPSLLRRS